jgi:hypothetical protein
MTDDPRAELEAMAQALTRGRERLDKINQQIDEIKPSFDELVDERAEVKRAIETIEDGIATTRRAYAVKAALEDKGIAYAHAMVVLVEGFRRPDPWVLCAVGTDGTGLYLYTPKRSHRYSGKQYAILGSEASEEERRGARQYASTTTSGMLAAGLVAHDTRGKGNFGAGSGSIVPLPPPGGGRWRWIKVGEQELLNVGGSDDPEGD